MDEGDVIRMLQGILQASTAPRDERWHSRYEDIPRAVKSAKEKVARTVGNLNLTDDALALEMGREWEPDCASAPSGASGSSGATIAGKSTAPSTT